MSEHHSQIDIYSYQVIIFKLSVQQTIQFLSYPRPILSSPYHPNLRFANDFFINVHKHKTPRLKENSPLHKSGATTVAFCSATFVCARMRPLSELPVTNVTAVFPKITPSICAPACAVTSPATTHTMFRASAPPASVTRCAAAMPRLPAIWKIHAVRVLVKTTIRNRKGMGNMEDALLVGPPEIVTPVAMFTPVVHL